MSNLIKPDIQVKNLELFYGDNKALKNINLVIESKKVTALIGPSGCGKSTFLRCINRMNDIIPYTRIAGDMTIDGESIYTIKYDVTQLRRRVGMVFQKSNPFPKSIFDNIAYGLKINGTKDRYIIEKTVEDFEKIGVKTINNNNGATKGKIVDIVSGIIRGQSCPQEKLDEIISLK